MHRSNVVIMSHQICDTGLTSNQHNRNVSYSLSRIRCMYPPRRIKGMYPASTSWAIVGPPSTTLAQHWFNIGSMSRVCWVDSPNPSSPCTCLKCHLSHILWHCHSGVKYDSVWMQKTPIKVNHSNAVLHHEANCWFNVGPASQTVGQH